MARSKLRPSVGRAAEVVAGSAPPGVRPGRRVTGVELRRVDQLASGQLGDVRLGVLHPAVGSLGQRVRRPVGRLPLDGIGVLLGVRPPGDGGGRARLQHLGHHPAELLAGEDVHVLRLVGRHQVPVAVGLPAAGGVEVGKAERVAVLVRDHAGLVDRRLGVDVVGPHPDERLQVVAHVGGGGLGVVLVGVPEGLALEVLQLVVGGVAGQPGLRVGVVELQRRRVRPDVVVGRAGVVAARDAELRAAVATTAGEDGHEEVDDAVLVGVEVGVVDLRVGDDRRVVDQLARRTAAGVDLLEGSDAGDGADQRGAVGVGAVVGGVARAGCRRRWRSGSGRRAFPRRPPGRPRGWLRCRSGRPRRW